jgi:DNA-binding MarR family transcriptional regulator
MAQLFVLQQLAESPALSIRALAERTITDPSSVSVVVSRAVSAGLVVRERDPRDARRARLVLTRRGRSILARAPRAGQESLIKGLDRLPTASRRALGRLLGDVVRHMGDSGHSPRLLFDKE